MWPIFVFWEMGLPNIVLHVVVGLLGLDLLFRFWRKRVTYLKVHDFRTSHSWCHIASFEHVITISIVCQYDLTELEFIFRPLTATSARCYCWLMGWCVILVGSVSTMNALKRQTRNSNVNQCQPTQSLWSIIGLKVNINKLFISLFKQLKFCSHDRKLAPRVSLPCLWNWVWNRTVFVWF